MTHPDRPTDLHTDPGRGLLHPALRAAVLLVLAFLAAACGPSSVGSLGPAAGPQDRPPAAVQAEAVLLPTASPAGGTTEDAAQPIDAASPPLDARPELAPAAAPDPLGSLPAPVLEQADPHSAAASVAEAVPDVCSQPAPPPLSAQMNGPERWRAFREPLPLASLWNPPGPRRVGLQAGHWQVEQVPDELSRLEHGAVGGGKQEWEVNLDLARRVGALLEAAGVEVDLLPATVPPRYRAHAFISIHADGDPSGRSRGFKIARPGFSSVPEADDRLVESLNAAYELATGLPRDDEHITPRMRYYYAFNSRRYCHAVAPGVPQAIVETGFLTNAEDRVLLLGNPDAAARGIANGLLEFLGLNPDGSARP